ncbi:hypothetical protein CVT25_005272 [Psilocybe cyanescens]|uniref:Uncharacterized protein n=1 Tax=Psilocybe cyanescens TaxID=93625 RepID=A0A409XDX6_PSICY|nr:hypothetical protein CVT25_005272 [Psilocybe cyanescens]
MTTKEDSRCAASDSGSEAGQRDPHAPTCLPNHHQQRQRCSSNSTTRIPSIWLITATPSATGLSASESSSSVSASFAREREVSWNVVAAAPPLPVPAPLPVHGYSPSLIAPKTKVLRGPSERGCRWEHAKEPRPREIEAQHPQHGDGARIHARPQSARIQDASCTYAYAMGGKDGFEIYLNPNYVDLDIGEILLVKTLRVVLDGVGPRPILPQASSPSPSLVIPHAPMSTTPASTFTSSSALTSMAHSNAHLPSSSPSAIATTMSMRPTAPSNIAPMATKEDEGNMEAGRRLVILQPERVGSVATMISAYSYNGTRSRSGTLNLAGGGMLAPPGAFGGENVDAQRWAGTIARRAIMRVWL